jgi:hypothetical protein
LPGIPLAVRVESRSTSRATALSAKLGEGCFRRLRSVEKVWIGPAIEGDFHFQWGTGHGATRGSPGAVIFFLNKSPKLIYKNFSVIAYSGS